MFGPDFLEKAIVAAPAILFALTVHEFFHAYTAFKFGDPTAANLGRMTLNPLAHLDIMGTLMLFLSNFMFGWAKPVPVNPMNLRNPRTADVWISAAGPLSNLGLGLIFGAISQGLQLFDVQAPDVVWLFLSLCVWINVSLAFFNLIPLYPLDGSHILRNLMPPQYDSFFDRMESIAPFLLLFLIITRVSSLVLGPFIHFFYGLFMGA